jgi:hypothetical protein
MLARRDLAILDQHAGAVEIADAAIQGEHDSVLQQDPAAAAARGS